MKNILKNIFFKPYYCLLRIVYLLCCIKKVDNNSIFVQGFSNSPLNDNNKYIIKELLKERKFKIYCCSNYRGDNELGVIYVKPKSLMALYAQAKSKIWIGNTRMSYGVFKRKGQLYFQTWHGDIRFKKVEQECPEKLNMRLVAIGKHDSKMIDYYVAGTSQIAELYENGFWKKGGEILRIGSPRNDIFFDETLNVVDLKEKIKIPNKKVLLYAPTFRKKGNLDVYNIEYDKIVSIMASKFGGEWIVAIRLHPLASHLSKEIVKRYPNVIDLTDYSDSQEILVCVDAIITDYSSIIFDFMLTNKPGFLYAPDLEAYVEERGFVEGFNYYDSPFQIARTNDDLINNINEFDCNIYNERINKFKNKIEIYSDGSASKKVCKIIDDYLRS